MCDVIDSDNILRCISTPSCLAGGELKYTAFSLRSGEKYVSFMLKRLCESYDFVKKRGNKIKYQTDDDYFFGVAQLNVGAINKSFPQEIEIKMEDKKGGPHTGMYYIKDDNCTEDEDRYYKVRKSESYPPMLMLIQMKLIQMAIVISSQEDFMKC